MGKEQRHVTSNDVAQASGVSRATVSYVLNNDIRQSIPSETRERVLKAVRDLGYRPSTAARTLRSGTSHIVLVVLPFEQVDPGLAQQLKLLEEGLAEHGFTLIWYVGMHNTLDIHSTDKHSHPAANVTPAVVVFFEHDQHPAMVSFLNEFNAPLVPLSTFTNRQDVGKIQVNYLFEQGRKHIVYAAPERADVQWLVHARFDGVCQGCAQLGLEPPVKYVIPFSRSEARSAIEQLLEEHPTPPLGICCYNDEVAFSVLAALADLEISIPDEVSVIGCDDIPLAQFSIPSLTTISFDYRTSTGFLVENILRAIQREPQQELVAHLPMLIKRASA